MAAVFSSEESPISESETNGQRGVDQEVVKSSESCKEMMSSTLPTGKGWTAEHMCQYQGFWYLSMAGVEGAMQVQKQFKARNEDILLITLPKSGTTWFKPLMFAIMNRGRYDPSSSHDSHPVLTTSPHDLVPPLENYIYQNIAFPSNKNNSQDSISSRQSLFHTHLPFTSLPQSVLTSQCRIVYVCRNPKDVFVSTFHFLNSMREKKGVEEVEKEELLSMKEAFEQFCNGVSLYGPFWDHVMGYWKASLERPERILFVKYEDMKKDSAAHLKRLAEFIGCPFSPQEERRGVVDEILRLCSFENLRNLKVNQTGTLRLGKREVGKHIFFRRGKVGDWRNHLTDDMVDRLNCIVEEKLSGSGLTFHYWID